MGQLHIAGMTERMKDKTDVDCKKDKHVWLTDSAVRGIRAHMAAHIDVSNESAAINEACEALANREISDSVHKHALAAQGELAKYYLSKHK